MRTILLLLLIILHTQIQAQTTRIENDLFAKVVTKFKKDKNNQVFILSGDKDLFSLISENVFVYDTMKKIVFDSEKTVEKF